MVYVHSIMVICVCLCVVYLFSVVHSILVKYVCLCVVYLFSVVHSMLVICVCLCVVYLFAVVHSMLVICVCLGVCSVSVCCCGFNEEFYYLFYRLDQTSYSKLQPLPIANDDEDVIDDDDDDFFHQFLASKSSKLRTNAELTDEVGFCCCFLSPSS